VAEVRLRRWAMMARTVELQAVIEALGKRDAGSGMRDAGSGPATPPVMRDADSRTPATHPASRISHPDQPPPEKGLLTLDRLRSLWPRIVEDARREKPMLGALLPAVEPSAIDGTTVVARALDPVHAEGLERDRKSTRLNSSHGSISY